MKKLLCIMLCLASASAHAGLISFAAGYVVGSSGSKSEQITATVLSSDKHDVITCKAHRHDVTKCDYPENSYNPYTPEQFASAMGYKIIYRKSAAVSGSVQYFVLEVGN
jgi:hypothetical protein